MQDYYIIVKWLFICIFPKFCTIEIWFISYLTIATVCRNTVKIWFLAAYFFEFLKTQFFKFIFREILQFLKLHICKPQWVIVCRYQLFIYFVKFWNEITGRKFNEKRKPTAQTISSESSSTTTTLTTTNFVFETTPTVQKKPRVFGRPLSETSERNVWEAAKASTTLLISSKIFSPDAQEEVIKVVEQSIKSLAKGGKGISSIKVEDTHDMKMKKLCKDPTIRGVLDTVKNTKDHDLRRRFMTLLFTNFSHKDVNKYGYGLTKFVQYKKRICCSPT